MRRLLLCTDLDGTLIPNGTKPEPPGCRKRFHEFVLQEEVTLAYVTGRHKKLMEEAISKYQLPPSRFAICDVGTTIYADGKRVGGWDREIDLDWNGYSRHDLAALFDGLDHLTLQEEGKQNKHKLSYYVPLRSDSTTLLQQMEALLKEREIHASLIWSVDEQKKVGLLDVLPESATKRHAIEFLMKEEGFSHEETLFAGDSGNDLPVLNSPIRSILVGNAADSIKNGIKEDRNLYIASASYSAGVLEGIAHFQPEATNWLMQPFDP